MAPRKDTSERIIVIGGGFAGLSIAARLGQAGLPVTLLEASKLGTEASTRNQGWLHSGGVFARQNVRLARMCHESLLQTLAFCPECLEPDHDGMFYVFSRNDALPGPWLSAWKEAAIPYESVPRSEVQAALPGIDLSQVQRAFRLPDRAIKTDLLLTMLAGAARNAGAELRTETPVVGLLREKRQVRGVLTGAGEEICGRLVINAAGTMTGGKLSEVWTAAVGEQCSYSRVVLKTHLVSVRPDLGRMPLCVVDGGGFNHLPHLQTSVFGSEHWYPVTDPTDVRVDPAETARIWEQVQRYFPHFDRAQALDIKEWAGTTVQALHVEQVAPGCAPLPTIIDHQVESPHFENLLSVYPGRATLWPQLAEQVRQAVLERCGTRTTDVSTPPWSVSRTG